MELNFSKINGTNNHLDYDVFKHSVISQLESTCKKAEVIILNKFPIVVSAQATIDFVILLNIPKKDKSWYRVELDDDRVNIKNQIIAVSVIDEYKDTSLSIKNGTIEAEGILPSFEEEATKLKWGLTNYLSNHCGLIRDYITIHPLIWVRNNSTYAVLENVLVAKDLDYKSVENVIKKNYYFKWQGYKDWYNSNDLFEHQIKKIFEQASKDSEEGYITKKKIDRFQRKLGSKQEEAFDYIGKQLVEVKGKAGTGKTADLLKWMLKGSLDGSKGVFLTYNHLLVYDITSQIQSFINRLPNDTVKASTSTITIHGWFYNIAKKLGVLLLMTEQRINELTSILDNRWVTIEKYFNQERRPGDTSLAWLKMRVQDHWNINEGIKREAILFIQFLDNHLTFLPDQNITSRWFKTFRDEKIEKLANLESSNIFLKDYHKVLERILQAVTDLDEFLDDFNVVDKFDLLSGHMKLSETLLEIDDPTKMNREIHPSLLLLEEYVPKPYDNL